jgi:hypothetical protein
MEEVARTISLEKELEDFPADSGVQVECAVHELELFCPAVEEPLEMLPQGGQGGLPDGNVKG